MVILRWIKYIIIENNIRISNLTSISNDVWDRGKILSRQKTGPPVRV